MPDQMNDAPPALPKIPDSPATDLVRQPTPVENFRAFLGLIFGIVAPLTALGGAYAAQVGKLAVWAAYAGAGVILLSALVQMVAPGVTHLFSTWIVVPSKPVTTDQAASISKLGKPPKP